MVDPVDVIRAGQQAGGGGGGGGGGASWESSDDDDGESQAGANVVFWHNARLGSAALALGLVTALEPILLKVMSDHAMVDEHRDYRYVLSQLLLLSHLPLAMGSGLWYAIKYSPTAMESCAFPKMWFILLAFLNALHMLMLFVPSGAVPGPLTVLLVHTQVPFVHVVSLAASAVMGFIEFVLPTLPVMFDDPEQDPDLSATDRMLFNQYGVGPGGLDTIQESGGEGARRSLVALPRAPSGARSRDQRKRPGLWKRGLEFVRANICPRPGAVVSSVIICAGAAIGMLPVLTKNGDALGFNSYCFVFHDKCLISTVYFVLSAAPAALSAVCLERTLVGYSVPVAPLLLHAWLVPMQFVFGVLLAPVGRHLQHPERPWVNISTQLGDLDTELVAGLKCVLQGKETGVDLIGFADPDWCKPLLPLLVLFVAVSFSFHMLTLYVMKHGTEVLLRLCTAGAIPFGWGVLAVYDLNFQPHVKPIVPTQVVISAFSKISMVCVMLGLLFHTTVEEPGTSYVLTSPFEERDRVFIEEASERHRRQLLEAKAQARTAAEASIGAVTTQAVDSLESAVARNECGQVALSQRAFEDT